MTTTSLPYNLEYLSQTKVRRPFLRSAGKCRPSHSLGNILEPGASVQWEVSFFHETGASCAVIRFRGEVDPHALSMKLKAVAALGRFWTRALYIRLLYQHSRTHSFAQLSYDLFGPNDCPPVTSIPCRSISTREQDDWDYALCILGN